MDVTREVATSQPASQPALERSSLTIECSGGRFAASSHDSVVSSDRKRVYPGEFYARDGGRFAAVAVVFNAADASFYGREVAALARNSFVGVGPAVYAFDARVEIDGVVCPAIIEEDSGVSLVDALFYGAEVPGTPDHPEWARPLAPIGSEQRAIENAKIAFDLLVQLHNLHEAGFFHRDVRSANVCMRRYGSAARDIRATLVDHELVDDYAGTAVPAAAELYERVLFEDLPREVDSRRAAIEPTSLMRDLGYLAAVEFECRNGKHIDEAHVNDIGYAGHAGYGDHAGYAAGSIPVFSYAEDGSPVMHMIDLEDDIAPLVFELGLTPVDAEHFPDSHLLARIRAEIHHGGFLDARDEQTVEAWATEGIDSQAGALARDVVFERWEQLAKSQGRVPAYPDFESQPKLLRESNIDQVRDIPNKIRLLGYRIVPATSAAAHERVCEFAPAEIEYAAHLEHRRWMDERLRAGWVYGEVRDDDRRVHPDLVPYNELSESSKNYGREAARDMLDVLDRLGLAVVR